MFLFNLSLEDFRSYRQIYVNFSAPLILLQGENAAGKTNLLEAIALLCTGRSFRGARDSEMARWGAEGYSIRARLGNYDLPRTLLLNYGPEGRSLSLDGCYLSGWGDISGQFPVVVFTPDDLQLLKGSPSLRRRFLDLILLQAQRSYRHHLHQYLRVLTQRNNLLRQLGPGHQAAAQLEVWDEQLVEHGSQVIKRRLDLLARLSPFMAEYYRGIAGEEMAVYACYHTELPISRESGLREIADAFHSRLRQLLGAEVLRGVTLAGPQRDDVQFLLDGHDVRIYASQGQQRTLALALKLAEVALLREQTGKAPLFLLDDVMSELDPRRRRLLLSSLPRPSQVFITCTQREEEFSLLDPGVTTFFEVRDGGLLSATCTGG